MAMIIGKIIGRLGLLSIAIIFRVRDINFSFYLRVLKTLAYILSWLYSICLFFDPNWNQKWGSEAELQHTLFFQHPLLNKSPSLPRLPRIPPSKISTKVHTPAGPCFDWKAAFDVTDEDSFFSNRVSSGGEGSGSPDDFGVPLFRQSVFNEPLDDESFHSRALNPQIPSERGDLINEIYGQPVFPSRTIKGGHNNSFGVSSPPPTLPEVHPARGKIKQRDSLESGVMHNIFHKWKLPKKSKSKILISDGTTHPQDLLIAPEDDVGQAAENPLNAPTLEILEPLKPIYLGPLESAELQPDDYAKQLSIHQLKPQNPNFEKFKNVFRKRPVST